MEETNIEIASPKQDDNLTPIKQDTLETQGKRSRVKRNFKNEASYKSLNLKNNYSFIMKIIRFRKICYFRGNTDCRP